MKWLVEPQGDMLFKICTIVICCSDGCFFNCGSDTCTNWRCPGIYCGTKIYPLP